MNNAFSGHSAAGTSTAREAWEWAAMTRSDDAVGDMHLPSRGADRNDYQDHGIPGWRQLLCAWFIVLTVAALFKISDFISTKQTAPFAHAIDLTQTADVEQSGE